MNVGSPILIAIPSKGRADKIMQHTLRWVPQTGFDWMLFVERQEYDSYMEATGARKHHNVPNCMVEDNCGLSGMKRAIKQHAVMGHYDFVFKMDDDILRFNGRGSNLPDNNMANSFRNMVAECLAVFAATPHLGAVGFPYRNELYVDKRWVKANARLQTAYIIRTELLNDGYNTFEDFAQYIHLRTNNYLTLRYGKLGIDCAPVGANRGGLQGADRLAMAKVEIEALRSLYPAIKFRRVDKPWQLEPDLNDEFYAMRAL